MIGSENYGRTALIRHVAVLSAGLHCPLRITTFNSKTIQPQTFLARALGYHARGDTFQPVDELSMKRLPTLEDYNECLIG